MMRRPALKPSGSPCDGCRTFPSRGLRRSDPWKTRPARNRDHLRVIDRTQVLGGFWTRPAHESRSDGGSAGADERPGNACRRFATPMNRRAPSREMRSIPRTKDSVSLAITSRRFATPERPRSLASCAQSATCSGRFSSAARLNARRVCERGMECVSVLRDCRHSIDWSSTR